MSNSTSVTKFRKIINDFSETFHKEYHGSHRVASPLGAWMLLAYVAVNHPSPSPKLLQRLGCSTDEAKEILKDLLKGTPDVIASAIQAWVNPDATQYASIRDWNDATNDVAKAKISTPTANELDAWAEEHSLGLIDKFPLEIDPASFIALFATMLATKIEWDQPFDVFPDTDMGTVWGQSKFLTDPNTSGDNISFYEDENGMYAIHRATNADNTLSVFSTVAVAGEPTEAETMSVARLMATGETANVSYRSLPLGASENGALTVEEVSTSSKKDRFVTILPAWRTENTYEISKSGELAYDDVANRFNDFPMAMEAVQVAVAEYQRKGFEAAALTTMIIGRCVAAMSTKKVVTVKFNQPYAVVAVAHGEGIWKNTPVFDGWISEAVEVKE